MIFLLTEIGSADTVPMMTNLETLTAQILTDAETCMAVGDHSGAEQSLQLLTQAEGQVELMHAIAADLTSLTLRREKLLRWLEQAQEARRS